jgi:hypothetical protein
VSDSQGQQGEPQGVGAVPDADGARGLAESGKILLELCDVGAAGKRAGIDDFGDGSEGFGANGFVMKFEIKEWDVHWE